MADILDVPDDNDVPSILLPCVSCNRTFRPEALAKHSKVCEKTLMKKRKKFDSSKQRIQGTDLAEFLPVLPTFTKKAEKSPVRKVQAQPSSGNLNSSSKSSLTSPKLEKTKWREKHNELVQTIQAARMPPGQAPVIKPASHETCPYCERSFGPKAYDRHLEWCKEQRTRIQPKSPASLRAKERQEARTKYRAPPVGKAKRSASRDKIQPDTSPQVIGTPLTVRKKMGQTNVLESCSAPNINQNFVKGTPLRSSTRGTRGGGGTSYKTPQSQTSRNPGLPCPNPSPKLNREGVNRQVPEMTIRGYECVEGFDNLDICEGIISSSDCPVISTYEIDLSGKFVATSTPHLDDGEEHEQMCVPELSIDVGSPGQSEEELPTDLNKTYTKDDLKELLECSFVKERPKRKNKIRQVENTSNHPSKINVKVKPTNLQKFKREKVEELKNNILHNYFPKNESMCNHSECSKLNEQIEFHNEETKDVDKENQLALVEDKSHVNIHPKKSNDLDLRNKNVVQGYNSLPEEAIENTSNGFSVLTLKDSLYESKNCFSSVVGEPGCSYPQRNYSTIKIDINFPSAIALKNNRILQHLYKGITSKFPLSIYLSLINSDNQIISSLKTPLEKYSSVNGVHSGFNLLMSFPPCGVGNKNGVFNVDTDLTTAICDYDKSQATEKPTMRNVESSLHPSLGKKVKSGLSKEKAADTSLFREYEPDTFWDYYEIDKINPKTLSVTDMSNVENCRQGSIKNGEDVNPTVENYCQGSIKKSEDVNPTVENCQRSIKNGEDINPTVENYLQGSIKKSEDNIPTVENYQGSIKKSEDVNPTLENCQGSVKNSEDGKIGLQNADLIDENNDKVDNELWVEHDDNSDGSSCTTYDSLDSRASGNRVLLSSGSLVCDEGGECQDENESADFANNKLRGFIIPAPCSLNTSAFCDDSYHSNSSVSKTQHTTVRKYECEETTLFQVNHHKKELNSVYSKTCLRSTSVEKDTCRRFRCDERNRNCLDKRSGRLPQLKPKRTYENLTECFQSNFKTEEHFEQVEGRHCKVVSSSSSEILMEKKTYFCDKNKKRARFTNTASTNSCSDLSLTSGNLKQSSKLPVLIKTKTQSDKPKKNKHWTEKYSDASENENYDKSLKQFSNLSQNSQSKRSEKMYQSLRNFAKAEIDTEAENFRFNRHKMLSPIASESVSVNSADTWSDSGSVYEVSDSVFTETSEEKIKSGSSQAGFQIRIAEENVCKRTFSDSVTLSSHRKHFQPSRPKIPFDIHNYCTPPAEPWGQEKCNRFDRTPRNSSPDGYDPYKSAERQMQELMEPELPKLAPITKTPTLVSSPTSAFTKFSSINSPEPLFIFENENDNLSKIETKSHASSEKSNSPLSITSPLDNYSSSKDNNQNTISLSTLSLCSTISIESVDSNKNGYRIGHSNSARVPEKKTPVPLRRTVSAFDSHKGCESRRGRDPLKGKLKMEDLLYGSNIVVEGERYFGSPIITGQTEKDDDDSSSTGSLHRAVSDAETLNAEQELLKSMSEFEKIFSSSSSSPSPSSPPLKLFPSLVSSFPTESMDKQHEMDFHSANQSGGPDSAYSSLNRKSPVGGEQEREPEGSAVTARFCHECGAKYPVLAAKFCCQCGVRRLVI